MPVLERFDFRVQHTRNGSLHRWRLFTYSIQIATGNERTNKEARVAARKAKEEYKQQLKTKTP